jgi:hypothetical protein
MLNSRPRRVTLAWLAALLLVAAAMPVGAGNGNNGTVKIHSGDASVGEEPSPEIKNEPHVSCPFHAHFFFGDDGQAGNPMGRDWWIVGHPPGGDGSAEGEYLADANGEYWTGVIELPAGHYKLYWVGRNSQNIKHKVFWVDDGCDGGGGGGGEPPPDGCPTPGDEPPCDEG